MQKLRFNADDGSPFPDWEEKKLGDVCTPLTYGMNAAAVKYDGENKYIRITDIDDESHLYKNDELVSPDGELDDKYLVGENDILLARTGASVGKSYLYDKKDGKLYYAGFLIKAHVKSENSKFIFYQTLTDRYARWVQVTSMRSGQPGINANEYSEFIVHVPSLPEQQKIAEFLSTVDTVIEKQKETVSAWEERKKGVMQKLFSQEVRFKADDGSDFPEWEEKKLGDICKTFSGGTPKSEEARYYENGTISFIRSGEIHDDKTELRITNDGLNESSAKMVDIGDVLYALYGATSGEVDISKIKGAINQAILCIRPLNDFNRKFIVEILRHNKETILRTYLQGGQGNLSAQILQSLVFDFPCLAEQQKIADCLVSFDEVIEKQKATLAAWEELKKGLLQQMFV